MWMRTFLAATDVADMDIDERKALLGLSPLHEHALCAARPVVEDAIDVLIHQFFDHQMQIPAVREVIEHHESLSNLKRLTRIYVMDLFGGCYDHAYVKTRRRIGQIHAAVGVPVKLYVSALHHMEQLLSAQLKRAGSDPAALDGLHKLFMLDIQFALDTFINGLFRLSTDQTSPPAALSEMVETTVAERTAEIARLAQTDHLTGLWNRRAFVEQLPLALRKAEAGRESLSLVFMDLDEFKKINDAHGHPAGDLILELIGQTFRRELGERYRAYRYGGDEFCVVMPGTNTSQARAELKLLTGKLRHVIGTKAQYDVGYSIGIATAEPGHYPDPDALLKAADHAMYAEKGEADSPLQA